MTGSTTCLDAGRKVDMNKPQKISTVLALAVFGLVVIWHYWADDILVAAGFPHNYRDEPRVGMALLAIAVFYAGTLAVLSEKKH